MSSETFPCHHDLLGMRPDKDCGCNPPKKHSHYFKDVRHLEEVDVYRVLDLFNVTNQAIGHAAKKLLVAGGRGVKDIEKDVQEAIDTLTRWQSMRKEDKKAESNNDPNRTP